MLTRSKILGHGYFLPSKVLKNEELLAFVDTSDEWISKRSGIKNRHFVSDNEKTSDMAFFAATKALENAQISKNDIDLIVLATTTPDNTFPSTATLVQKKFCGWTFRWYFNHIKSCRA